VCLNPHVDEPIGMSAEPDASRCERQCPLAGHERAAAQAELEAPQPSTERCLLVADPGCSAVPVLDGGVAVVPAIVSFDERLLSVALEFRSNGPYHSPSPQRFTPPPERG
jgi:hypothetical protein